MITSLFLPCKHVSSGFLSPFLVHDLDMVQAHDGIAPAPPPPEGSNVGLGTAVNGRPWSFNIAFAEGEGGGRGETAQRIQCRVYSRVNMGDFTL